MELSQAITLTVVFVFAPLSIGGPAAAGLLHPTHTVTASAVERGLEAGQR